MWAGERAGEWGKSVLRTVRGLAERGNANTSGLPGMRAPIAWAARPANDRLPDPCLLAMPSSRMGRSCSFDSFGLFFF